MKRILYAICFSIMFMALSAIKSKAQVSARPVTMPGVSNPWNDGDLLEPADLVNAIKPGNTKPFILNIGPVENIPGATHIGAVSNPKNMNTLQKTLVPLPRNTAVVIYCGCCPFAKCPNIRPAFNELKKLGFTNVKVLNLTTNLKTNWIEKGYPLAKD
jgi:hypothetical protein